VLFVQGLAVASPTPYEYSDADGYGTAKHKTGRWQRLGTAYNKEYSPQVNDTSDDGVFWSVDGGSTWGHDDLSIGNSVTFRFDMTRSLDGIHQYDQLKAWVDWNGDKDWNDAGEQVIAEQWFKADDAGITSKSFEATYIVPDYASIGETWLRARVHCDHVSFADHNPYTYMSQGEVEDYQMNISAVPVPSAIGLVGFGIIGLRRFKKKLLG